MKNIKILKIIAHGAHCQFYYFLGKLNIEFRSNEKVSFWDRHF